MALNFNKTMGTMGSRILDDLSAPQNEIIDLTLTPPAKRPIGRRTDHISCDFVIDLDTPTQSAEKEKFSSQVKAAPVIIAQPKASIGDCPICVDPLGIRTLASTKCGHVFCKACLELALKVDKKCPSCRTMLENKTDYHPLYLTMNSMP